MAHIIFVLWTFILIGRPQDYFVFLEPFRLALVFTLIALVSTLFSGNISFNTIWKSKESKLYALFYLLLILGIPFAYHRRVAFNAIFLVYIVNIVFYCLFIINIKSADKMKDIVFVIVLCGFFYNFVGILSGSFIMGRFVTYGEMYDPNDMAFIAFALLPASFYYLMCEKGVMKTTVSVLSIFSSILMILFTGSRAGIITFALSFIMFFIFFKKRIKFSYFALFIVITAIMLAWKSESINFERFMTLGNMDNDYNVTDETGRMTIWERGFDLFLRNPITGVGVDCFPMAIGYLREGMGIIPKWQTAHNSYVQIMVETGLAGFIPYMYLIYICISNFNKIRVGTGKEGDAEKAVIMASLFQIGFISLLFDAFFLSQGYSLLLTIYFAISVSMKNIFLSPSPGKN